MVGNLMVVVSLWNSQKGDHVVHRSILAEVLLLDLYVALIVALMATGLVIARLGTRRISAIVVVKEAILKGSAKIVQSNSGAGGVVRQLNHVLLAMEEPVAPVTAEEAAAIAVQGPKQGESRARIAMTYQGALLTGRVHCPQKEGGSAA